MWFSNLQRGGFRVWGARAHALFRIVRSILRCRCDRNKSHNLARSMLTNFQAWAEACTLLSGSQLCYHKEWQKQIMIT